jgi:hypothetical protein
MAVELFEAGVHRGGWCWRPWMRCVRPSICSPRRRGEGLCRPCAFTTGGCLSLSPCHRRQPTRGAALSTVRRSKAGAKGLALLAATLRGGVLEGLVSAREMDRIRDAISSSLTGQVASLHLPPLPFDTLNALVGTLRSRANFRERVGSHEGTMARRMLEHRRGRSRAARTGSGCRCGCCRPPRGG